MCNLTLNTNNDYIILQIICKKDTQIKKIINEIEKHKCPYCGKIFKKDKKHKKYCSKKCQIEAQKDKNTEKTRKHRKKYKNTLDEKTKKGLGTKGAYLKQHPNSDYEKEHQSIKNEYRRLKLT